MRRKVQQLEFDFRQHGGKRKGAGRKPKNAKPGMPHRQRSTKKRGEPLHITVRLAEGLPSLRRGDALKLVLAALSASSDRHGMRTSTTPCRAITCTCSSKPMIVSASRAA
ncbi:MAG: hypothetical protein IPN34_02430 [Planctomycetes bacterium]|nr:hypothetical protein [Planctomycetota bacterium]